MQLYSNAIFDDDAIEDGLFDGEQSMHGSVGSKVPSPPGSTATHPSHAASPPTANRRSRSNFPTISDEMPTDTSLYEAIQDEDRYENSYSTWGLMSDHDSSNESSENY